MPTFIERVADGLGKAVGAYRRGVNQVLTRGRAAFLSAWAESGRWKGGDLTTRWAQRRALQNSWVFTAVGLIVREVSAAEIEVVRHGDVDEEPVAENNHPFERLIRRPNPFMGRSFLWQYTTYWLKLDGNAYWFVSGNPGQEPLELWPLPARDVEPIPGDADRFIDHYEYNVNGTIYQIPAEYVVHFKQPNPFDVFRGMSELMAAMLPIDADTAMARWNGTFFGRDNVMPSAIINLSSGDATTPINPSDADRLKADLRSEYQASQRRTAVTTANSVSAVLLGWNPKDMDFIAGRQFTKEEIYSILGLPGGLLDKNATEANATIADRIFKEKTIWPLLCLLAEQITAQLIIPFYGEEVEARFKDIRPVNRQLELQEVTAARPYLLVDEVRQKYWNLEALPNGEGQKLAQASSPTMDELLLANGDGQGPSGMPAMRADLRRWRDKALKAFKNGKAPLVSFESLSIPIEVMDRVRDGLRCATTPEEVKAAFSEVAVPEVAAVHPFQSWEEYG